MKKKTRAVEPPEVEEVRLKPLFGMEPGKYLTILYAVLLIIILFALFMYPGIRNHGSNLRVTSAPAGAALYVDGSYRGSTPVRVFLSSGTHEIRLEHEYFTTKEVTREIGGRLVGSLFFPRREQLHLRLDLTNRKALLEEGFRRASNWALVGTFHDRYRYPAIAVETVLDVISQQDSGEEKPASESAVSTVLSDFLYNFTNNMSSPEHTQDMAAALGLLFEEPSLSELRSGSYPARGSDIPPEIAAGSLVDLFRQVDIESELLPLYLFLAADDAEAQDFAQELSLDGVLTRLENGAKELSFREYYSAAAEKDGSVQTAAGREADETENSREGAAEIFGEKSSYSLMGHEFLLFAPERPAPLGNPEASFSLEELSYEELASYPHREEIRPFYMATAETNQAQFERFLEDNPQWRKANLAELLAEGSVTEEYLEYSNTGDRIPVTNVSWFAARAYCRWLTGQLPENLQGEYRAVLPTESQWEYAARSNGRPRSVGRELRVNAPLPAAFSRAGARGLIDMTGNVWEWNRNWYFLADLLDGTYGLNQNNRAGMERAEFPVYRGAEKSVRGGSWANEIDGQMVWSRASQEPSWCTPFTGFRVALVSAEDGSPGQDESR